MRVEKDERGRLLVARSAGSSSVAGDERVLDQPEMAGDPAWVVVVVADLDPGAVAAARAPAARDNGGADAGSRAGPHAGLVAEGAAELSVSGQTQAPITANGLQVSASGKESR